jgi:hypothetical protein
MAEKDLWATMRDKVKFFGHFERIENMVGAGRPDVNFCVRGVEGNIELKQRNTWPARPNTVVEVDHFTSKQRTWIRTRLSAGGRVYVLMEVMRPRPEYLLFSGRWAIANLGLTATQVDCQNAALVWKTGAFPTDFIISAITDVVPTP